jgi:endonuclease YncB( thermonuclease family)
MRLIQSLITIAVFLFVTADPCVASTPIRSIEGMVTKVVDGDTINVTDNLGTKVKVRFYGVDAPETAKPGKHGQPFGEEAHQTLLSKVNRQRVRLDVMDVDQYRRAVCIVWLGTRNINMEMISEGWAFSYRQYLGRPHASEYILAEERARNARLGLWQQSNPQPPWLFRKAQRNWR